jgi:hypothetical protein
MRVATFILLAATSCTVMWLAPAPAMAKKPPCSASEIAIADDRGSGKLCLKKSEWEKARKICAKNGSSDPMGCICQDGDSVGACGD